MDSTRVDIVTNKRVVFVTISILSVFVNLWGGGGQLEIVFYKFDQDLIGYLNGNAENLESS